MSKHKEVDIVEFNTCIKFCLHKPIINKYQFRLMKLSSRSRIIWLSSRSRSRLSLMESIDVDDNIYNNNRV